MLIWIALINTVTYIKCVYVFTIKSFRLTHAKVCLPVTFISNLFIDAVNSHRSYSVKWQDDQWIMNLKRWRKGGCSLFWNTIPAFRWKDRENLRKTQSGQPGSSLTFEPKPSTYKAAAITIKPQCSHLLLSQYKLKNYPILSLKTREIYV